MRRALMFLVILVLLTGCSFSREEREKRDKYYSQAKENAVNYIENKYGFSPEVLFVECNYEDVFGRVCSEEIFVNMKYNDKRFQVFISGSTTTLYGYDNYQYEQVVQDYVKEIENRTGLKPYDYSVIYSANHSAGDGFLSEFYNVGDLQLILDKYDLEVLFEYIGVKEFNDYINKDTLKDLINEHKVVFVNYFSKESYNNASTHHYHLGTETMDSLKMNVMNIESSVVVQFGNVDYYNFDLIEFDDVRFYFSENNPMTVSRSDIDFMDDWKGSDDVEILSDVYSIDIYDDINSNGSESVYVYFPVDKVRTRFTKKIMMLVRCNNVSDENVRYYDFNYAKVIGNYYVEQIFFNCDNDNVKFVIAKV